MVIAFLVQMTDRGLYLISQADDFLVLEHCPQIGRNKKWV